MMGKDFCCPVFFGLAKKVGQKKGRNGQKRIHPHALHGYVKKPSKKPKQLALKIVTHIAAYENTYSALGSYEAALASSLS